MTGASRAFLINEELQTISYIIYIHPLNASFARKVRIKTAQSGNTGCRGFDGNEAY